jgi:hypothetical protein
MRMQKWPTYAAYGVLSCALFLGSFPRALWGFKPHEIALLLLAGALFVRRVLRQDARMTLTPLDSAFGFLVLFGTLLPLVVMEIRGAYIDGTALKSLLAPVEWWLWYRVFLEAVPMPQEILRLLRLLLILLSIIGLVGDLQAVHVPGIAHLLSLVSATHQTAISGSVLRPTSLVGEWGLMASLCGFALLLINQIATDRLGPLVFGTRWRIWLISLTAINVLAVVSALAVEAFLALGIGYVCAYLVNRRRLARETVGVGGLAALSALILFPLVLNRLNLQFGGSGSFVPATWQVRFLHWQIVLHSIFQSASTIVFGVNPSFVYPVLQFGGTESLYWLIWYRGGILYLLAFVGFLVYVVIATWRLRAAALIRVERSFLTWAWILLIVIGCVGVIDALFVDGGEVQLLLTVIAALGRLIPLDRVGMVEVSLAQRLSVARG